MWHSLIKRGSKHKVIHDNGDYIYVLCVLSLFELKSPYNSIYIDICSNWDNAYDK
jgi:hypothetical protein